jgi:hypothetical protein
VSSSVSPFQLNAQFGQVHPGGARDPERSAVRSEMAIEYYSDDQALVAVRISTIVNCIHSVLVRRPSASIG